MERKRGRNKGNAWWTNEIKDAVEWKKRAYKKVLQRNMPEGVKARRKSEYKEWKKKVRELIKESKRRVDEEFGRKLSQNFCKNKFFWKEVKKMVGEGGGDVRMRREDGEPVGGESKLKRLWKGYFEQLMNNEKQKGKQW